MSLTHAGAVPSERTVADRVARENVKLEKRLLRLTGQAIADFNMIESGDKVMVCLSGGKDSYSLLEVLLLLRERAPIFFDIVAVNLDQKQPGFPGDVLPAVSARARHRLPYRDAGHLFGRHARDPGRQDLLLAVRAPAARHPVPGGRRTGRDEDRAGPPSRRHPRNLLPEHVLRRPAQGHAAETHSDDGRNVVIRPLAYVKETDLASYAQAKQFPIIPCNLCGSQDNLKRKEVKRMLLEWERRYPGRVENTFNALSRITPSHLMDSALYDFSGLRVTGVPSPDGDIAFDEDPCESDATDPTAGVIRFAEAE